MSEDAYSAKGLAIELDTNARTIRKFFRSAASPIDPVGQGNRYEVEPEDLEEVKKAFKKWSTPKPAVKKPTPGAPDDDEEIDLEDLDGPSEEELIDLELEDMA